MLVGSRIIIISVVKCETALNCWGWEARRFDFAFCKDLNFDIKNIIVFFLRLQVINYDELAKKFQLSDY